MTPFLSNDFPGMRVEVDVRPHIISERASEASELSHCSCQSRFEIRTYMWQTQVENEHYSTVSGLIRLVISLECFIEITPDFLCPFMND